MSRRRAPPFLIRALQLVALLLTFQISGVAHFIADTFFDDDMTCADEKQHSPDKGRCPLGGGHADAEVIASAPVGIATPLILPALESTTALDRSVTQIAGRRLVGGIFRPPRSIAHSS